MRRIASLLGIALLPAMTFGSRLDAGMTAAWKVFYGYWPAGPEKKLGSPPAPSAFFAPDAELRDVLEAMPWIDKTRPQYELVHEFSDPFDPFDPLSEPKRHLADQPFELPEWTGEWVVRDIRSDMFVARGTRNELTATEQCIEEFIRGRLGMATKLEKLNRKTGAVASLTLRSWFAVEAEAETSSWKMTVEASSDNPIYFRTNANRLKLTTSWPTGEPGEKWEVVSSLMMPDGQRTLVARQTDWELWATVNEVLVDGTPMREMKQTEEDGKIRTDASLSGPLIVEREALDNGYQISWWSFPAEHNHTEPFPPLFSERASVAIPPALASKIHGNLMKIPWMKKAFFAGYDPRADMIVIVNRKGDPDPLELSSQLFYRLPVVHTTEVNEAAGGWYLATEKDEVGYIAKTNGTKRELFFEPTFTTASSGETAFLEITMDAVANESSAAKLNSSITAPLGQAVKIGGYRKADGVEVPIEATVRETKIFK